MLKNFYIGRKKIIEGFENKVFPLYYNEAYEYQMKAQREIEEERRRKEEEQEQQNKKPFDPEETIEWMINKEDAHVNNELFKKHFKVETPSLMYKVLHKTNDKEKNSELVNIFNSGLKDLKEEI